MSEGIHDVLAHGVRLHGRFFSLTGHTAARTRFTVVVPTRTAPRAVDRSRMKRRTREAFMRVHTHFTHTDTVIFPRKAVLSAAFQDITNELAHHGSRLQHHHAGG